MMRSCWASDAAQRPSFSELVHWLYRRLRPMTRDDVIANVTNSSNGSVNDQCQSRNGAPV